MEVVEGGGEGWGVGWSGVDVSVGNATGFKLFLDFGMGHSCTKLARLCVEKELESKWEKSSPAISIKLSQYPRLDPESTQRRITHPCPCVLNSRIRQNLPIFTLTNNRHWRWRRAYPRHIQPPNVLHNQGLVHAIRHERNIDERIAKVVVCDHQDKVVIREGCELDEEYAADCLAEFCEFWLDEMM